MTAELPTRAEIDVFGSLDGATAYRHFFGKTLVEAEALFRENSLLYQEDLMWMGPRAFKFYLPAATHYLASEAARGDADLVNCLLGNIRWRRANRDDEGLALAAGEIRELIDVVMTDYTKFEVDEGIYGDLLAGYRDLVLAATP